MELVKKEDLVPEVIFTEQGIQPILQAIKKKADAFTADVETPSGRQEIKSFAYKIAQSKTLIDSAGKEFLASKKEEIKKGDKARKIAKDFLIELKDEVRKPLTEWEEKEKARIEAEQLAIELEQSHIDALVENDLFNRQREVEQKEAELKRQEEERLEKERKAKEEEERQESLARLEAEAAAKAKREAEENVRKEKERLEREKKEAEEKAAQAERDRIASEERAKVEKENAVKEAERKAKAEAEKKELARLESIRMEKEATEARAKKKAHRNKIKKEATRFIKGINGTTQETADLIFESIALGEVPHIKVIF